MKNILIICDGDAVRRVWIEGFLRDVVKENDIDAIVNSAVSSTFGARQLTREMLETSDLIFAVDKKIYEEISTIYTETISYKKVINLDILDIYDEFGEYNNLLVQHKIKEMSAKDQNLFTNRPEIRHHLTLREILNIKKHLILEIILMLI